MLKLHRLQPLEHTWEEIEASYRIAPYNAPLNRAEEYRKVLAAYQRGTGYNPQFVYQPPPDYPVARIQAFMATLQPENSPIEQIYAEKARNELLTIHSIQTHAPELITAVTSLVNGLPDTTLLAEAWRILKEEVPPQTDEPADIPAEQAASRMQRIIDTAGLDGWQAIVFAPMSAGMSVNRLDKQLKIRQGDTCSSSDLQRLIVHEIGVHILRYENGSRQPVRLLRNSFPGYEASEEGLAVYSESRAGLLKTSTLRRYAGRVIAANLALSQPFSDVFLTLAPEIGAEDAFNIVSRAKRGFTDTSQPGAHVKDLVYLKGYLQVSAHLEEHPEDYPLLFLGKFGLQHLPLVKSFLADETISLPTFLPDMLHDPAE